MVEVVVTFGFGENDDDVIDWSKEDSKCRPKCGAFVEIPLGDTIKRAVPGEPETTPIAAHPMVFLRLSTIMHVAYLRSVGGGTESVCLVDDPIPSLCQ